MTRLFDHLTSSCAKFAGRPTMMAFCLLLALAGIAAFALDNDRLVAGTNLAISIVTLLMFPILQASQNRDGAALHAQIEELIDATPDARNDLIGLEQRSEAEIAELRVGGE